jgi:uncharacterized membrane-anchored protein
MLLMRKVPEVTIFFWIIKLLTTAMGESVSDYFVFTYNPYVVVLAGFAGFLVALVLQFTVRRYIPAVYWLAVLMVAVFGTMAADVTHVVLGVPYAVSTGAFILALGVIFFLWKRREGTLSIHTINTQRRELFYWAAVLATFALGTAAGDLAAYSAGLGFFAAGVMFAVVFAIPGLGYRFLGWNSIFCFWFAYIMTRPLGASFADWTGKTVNSGGLGWGDGKVAAVLGLLIVGLVLYLSVSKVDSGKSQALPNRTDTGYAHADVDGTE